MGDYDDNRVPPPEFKAMQSSLPLGQLPILEVDGTTITQSEAILRYAGKKSGLYPTDPLLAAQVDEVQSIVGDYAAVLSRSMGKPDEKEALRKEIAETVIPKLFPYLEKKAKDNSSGFLVGSSVTTADLTVFFVVQSLQSGKLDGIPTTVVDSYPSLIALKEKVGAIPEVQAHLASY